MRRTIENHETNWNWPVGATHKLPEHTAHETENWPTPRELFFETGIVLGVALGLCAIVDLLLTLTGVPQP